MAPVYCDQCKKVALGGKPLKTCDGCKSVHYCSRDCQIEAWKAGHKACCKSLAENRQTLIQELGKKKVKEYRSVEDYVAEHRPQLTYLSHKLLQGHHLEDVAMLRVVRQEPADRRPAYKLVEAKRLSMQELEATAGNPVVVELMRSELTRDASATVPRAHVLFVDGEGTGDRLACTAYCLPLSSCEEGSAALAAHLSSPAAFSAKRVTQLINNGQAQEVLDVMSNAVRALVPSIEQLMRDPSCMQRLLESMARESSSNRPGPSKERIQEMLDPKAGDASALVDFLQSSFPLPVSTRRQLAQTLEDRGQGCITACEAALGKARAARK